MAHKFLHHLTRSLNTTNARLSLRKQDSHLQLVYGVLRRCLSRHTSLTDEKARSTELSNANEPSQAGKLTPNELKTDSVAVAKDDSNDSEGWRSKLEAVWLSKALEPALQLYKWASSAGNGGKHRTSSDSRSFTEILTSIQHSKIGIEGWSLSDFTVGLYFIYLSQASARSAKDFTGVQIFADETVQELIYHLELAKGAYKANANSLAYHSMLREKNIVKFVNDSSVMRPGYYIGIDKRNKLVIFGIRGTHTVYDIITNVVSSNNQEVSFEGFSTHFGTAEAARWFLNHEIETVRRCLEKHKGYKLRIVGHSLGGAAAALLAIMLRRKTEAELGFNPDIVSSVGFGTPPCVSKELAESCSSFVSTVVLQDDIVPRLSVVSLARLRNEILETDWLTILEKEEWKGVVDLVTNAKQVIASVQDVARKLADYARITQLSASNELAKKSESISAMNPQDVGTLTLQDGKLPEELFIPGAFYYLKRDTEKTAGDKSTDSYSLWMRQKDDHFRRLVLTGNLISDHRCESHYYALRDVLKSLPPSSNGVCA